MDIEKLTPIFDRIEAKLAEHGEALLDLEQKSGSIVHKASSHNSVADTLLKSNEIQAFAERKIRAAGTAVKAASLLPPLSVKNTIVSAAATNPPQQEPGVVGGPVPRSYLRQFLRTLPATASSIVYTKENVYTNSAAAQATEGGEKAESGITFTEVTQAVATYAHWLKMSRQVMDDNAALTAFVEMRLRQGLEIAIENGLINGAGTSGTFDGLTKSGNFTAFTPTASETALDGIRRCKEALETADFRASLVCLNPADVSALERAKDSQNAYLIGNPLYGGLPSVWGIPIHVTTKVTSGKVLMLDTEQAVSLYVRDEAQVDMSDSDDDNFTKNLITVRCEARLALAVQLPAGVRYGDLTSA